MNYEVLFNDRVNIFEIDLEEYLKHSFEEFLDNLLDANILSLSLNESILSFGKGMVNIHCKFNHTSTDKEGMSTTKQIFNIEFQADPSIQVELSYASFTQDEQKLLNEGKFKHWISFKYIDDQNNSFPWENDYYYELIEDLTI